MYNTIGLAQGNACMVANGTDAYQCFYCYDIRHCEHCFGCVALQHKKYCIFNKQYTKEEYEAKLAKLIEKMQDTGEW